MLTHKLCKEGANLPLIDTHMAVSLRWEQSHGMQFLLPCRHLVVLSQEDIVAGRQEGRGEAGTDQSVLHSVLTLCL